MVRSTPPSLLPLVLILDIDDILKMGVDDVYCISMNDAFVMRQVREYESPLAYYSPFSALDDSGESHKD